ncbi:7TM-DISM domain-containing protein [Natronosalvus rutilus]|uniref:7TM-DISM domain-containing protein n=1 Tax=Natronosalvus rutilus TaxID=2953753 RepID=A0A9E7N957_9EURY|nr:7TM-DISM domain-containing protein [Natronosalvus rutilus]UTF53730.1 7TM-DISM domain-containing protein [Natronosalvus rutilus]
MSERSDEVSVDDDEAQSSGQREPTERGGSGADTDDLLAETERLLEGGSGASTDAGVSADAETRSTPPSESTTDSSWKRKWNPLSRPRFGGSIRDRLSPSRYLSPRSLLATVLTLGFGMVAGGIVLPFSGIGRLLGLFAMAFVIGVAASRRRYLEVGFSGAGIGALAVLLDFALFLPTDSGRYLLAIGAGAGLLASVIGYYFGRDLRAGLARDIE